MNRTICALLVLLVFVACALVSINSYNQGVSVGKKVGAKIALSLESPDDYRAEEVRGACEDYFPEDECIMCHDFYKEK